MTLLLSVFTRVKMENSNHETHLGAGMLNTVRWVSFYQDFSEPLIETKY